MARKVTDITHLLHSVELVEDVSPKTGNEYSMIVTKMKGPKNPIPLKGAFVDDVLNMFLEVAQEKYEKDKKDKEDFAKDLKD